MEERAHLFRQLPGGVGGKNPQWHSLIPAGSADFSRPRTPLNGARSPPSPLTDSADTQATKPKVSRIQARCIFPEDRLGAAACNEGKTKPLAQHQAQPAQRDPELEAPAGGSGVLAASSCSRVFGCAPGTQFLLTCWFLHS